MRYLFRLAGIVFLSFCLFSPQGRAEDTWYLRVIARDDSTAAQAEKLRVRDAVLFLCPERAQDLAAALPDIHAAVQAIAPCAMEIRSWTPDAARVPAAPTLYVTVGAGQGHNWWGLLYEDSLLMAQAEADDTEEITFVWPIVTWFLRLLGWG